MRATTFRGFQTCLARAAGTETVLVTYADWQRIDKVEVAEGKKVGKPREKLTTIPELLTAAGK
jgi:hypothetical protein